MLQLIQTGYTLPVSYPVDPTATFQSGMIGELKLIGNEIVLGTSSGLAPIGIIDDERSTAFTQAVIDEIVIIGTAGTPTSDGYGNFLTPMDAKQELNEVNIVRTSFQADVEGLVLNEKNGLLTAPAGTKLNYDDNGDGYNDSVRAIVSYIHQIEGIPGDDSTVGSGRATVWFQRGIFATDQFDTTAKYPLNATLYVNEEGKLTTKQATKDHPGIGVVLGPPTALVITLQFLWL